MSATAAFSDHPKHAQGCVKPRRQQASQLLIREPGSIPPPPPPPSPYSPDRPEEANYISLGWPSAEKQAPTGLVLGGKMKIACGVD